MLSKLRQPLVSKDKSTQKKQSCNISMVIGALSHAADDFIALGIWITMAVALLNDDKPVSPLLYGLIGYGLLSGVVETILSAAENDLENLEHEHPEHEHPEHEHPEHKHHELDHQEHVHRKLPWEANSLIYLGSIIMNAVRFYNITISLADAKAGSSSQSLTNPCDVAWSKFTVELTESPYQSIAVACVLAPAVYFNAKQCVHSLGHVNEKQNLCLEIRKAMLPTFGYMFVSLSMLGMGVSNISEIANVDAYQGVISFSLMLAVWAFNAVRQGLEFSADGGRCCDKGLVLALALTPLTLAGDMPILGPINPNLGVILPNMLLACAVGVADNGYHISMFRRLRERNYKDSLLTNEVAQNVV